MTLLNFLLRIVLPHDTIIYFDIFYKYSNTLCIQFLLDLSSLVNDEFDCTIMIKVLLNKFLSDYQ